MRDNQLASMSGLQSLTALTRLHLDTNRIGQLSGLPAGGRLLALGLSANGLGGLGGGLAACAATLQELHLSRWVVSSSTGRTRVITLVVLVVPTCCCVNDVCDEHIGDSRFTALARTVSSCTLGALVPGSQ